MGTPRRRLVKTRLPTTRDPALGRISTRSAASNRARPRTDRRRRYGSDATARRGADGRRSTAQTYGLPCARRPRAGDPAPLDEGGVYALPPRAPLLPTGTLGT